MERTVEESAAERMVEESWTEESAAEESDRRGCAGEGGRTECGERVAEEVQRRGRPKRVGGTEESVAEESAKKAVEESAKRVRTLTKSEIELPLVPGHSFRVKDVLISFDQGNDSVKRYQSRN